MTFLVTPEKSFNLFVNLMNGCRWISFEKKVLQFMTRSGMDINCVNFDYLRTSVVKTNYIDLLLSPAVKLRYHSTLPYLVLVDYADIVLHQGPKISILEWQFYTLFCHLWWYARLLPNFRNYRFSMSISQRSIKSGKIQLLPSSAQTKTQKNRQAGVISLEAYRYSRTFKRLRKKRLFWGSLLLLALLLILWTLL